jgi:UDP:flavonoid glycosyltransferase YjiC (YdhE family)
MAVREISRLDRTAGAGVQVLLATTAGADHLGPLVTFGVACHRFGHDFVVAAPASFAAAVQRAGFAHAPFADPAPAVRDAVTADIPGLAAHEANVRVIRDGFARIDATAALPGLQALLGAWRPDVIIRETFEYGSYGAAERNEIPYAQVGVVLAWFEEFGLSVVEAPLNELRASVGLSPDTGLVRLRAAPHLTCVPMSLEDLAVPGPGRTYRFWDSATDRRGAGVADWWNGSSAPLVYVSLGTAAARPGLFPDLDRAVVGSLADLPVRVVLTTGGGDPVALAELRPLVPVGRPVVGTAGAGWGDVVGRHRDRVGRVGEVDHVGASHVPGVDGGLRDAEQPPSRKSSRQFAIAVCETPSRRVASATPVGGGAEARPPADGP